MLAVGKHGIHPADDAERGFAEERIASDGVAVQIILQKLGIIVGHLFEMGHEPAFVDGIAVESAAHLIVNAAASHFLERGLRREQ